MPIPASAVITKATFDLGSLGTYTVGVEDDAGTLRIAHRYNGSLIRWVTPAGGHTEDHKSGSIPSGYELS